MSLEEKMANVDDIREFVAVARHCSFTVAASKLDVTASSLSKAVMRLESRLGVKLLHRSTRQVALTNEGQVYFATCVRVLADLEDAENLLSSRTQTPKGTLRLDLPTAFGRRHVVPALLDLCEEFDGIDLSVSFSERNIDLVAEGIDMAIRIGTFRDHPDLVAKQLGIQKLVICASPAYISRMGRPASRDELVDHDCIGGSPTSNDSSWWIQGGADGMSGFSVSIRHQFSDPESMLAAALAGRGIAQLPVWLVKGNLQNGSLLELLRNQSPTFLPIYALWPKSRYMQPKLRALLERLDAIAQEAGCKPDRDDPYQPPTSLE